MEFKAVEDILPRDQNDVKELLYNFSNLVDDAVNFGTHLLKWDTEKNLQGDENLIPLLFLRNILEVADAISILIKSSSIDTSKALLRILLENVFGLEYLLEKDTTNRALSFIVWMTNKDLKFYERLNNETNSGKQFRSEFAKDSLIKNPGLINKVDYAFAKENSEELLKLPHYISIQAEYERTILKDKNPSWYSLYSGPKNIEQLAKYLGRNAIYEVMYRGYSGNVHATDIFKGKLLTNKEGKADIIQMRNPKDAQSIAVSAVNYLIMAYISYCRIRVPSKNNDFALWYSKFRIDFEKLRDEKNSIEFI